MIWPQTLLAGLLLAGTVSSPSPPQGTRQLQVVSLPCCPRGVPWEVRHSPSCDVFDGEPAASPPARHSCGTLAAAAQIVSCVHALLQGAYDQPGVVPEAQRKASSFLLPGELQTSYLGLPQHPSERLLGGNYIVLSHFSAGS